MTSQQTSQQTSISSKFSATAVNNFVVRTDDDYLYAGQLSSIIHTRFDNDVGFVASILSYGKDQLPYTKVVVTLEGVSSSSLLATTPRWRFRNDHPTTDTTTSSTSE